MTTTKLTKKDMFNALLEVFNDCNAMYDFLYLKNADIAEGMEEFLTHEIELLNRKASSKTTKPSKTQVENVAIKATILEVLKKAGSPMCISDLQGADSGLGSLTNQRISALLTQLKNAGQVVRTTDKKKAYFSIA